MKVCILFHDNCFDGLASAGLFHAFIEEKTATDVETVFGGLVHGHQDGAADCRVDSGSLCSERLVGDVNAIVDFRYLSDDLLHWWFDHHKSAFVRDEDRLHFQRDESGRKYYDPKAPSCAGLISKVLARDHGLDTAPFAELIHWAEIIDSASFPDPKTAVELDEPALRLMTWIENSRVFAERAELIPRMVREPLERVAGIPFVEKGLEPVLASHWENVDLVRKRHRREGDVVWCDLTDRVIDAVNKFIPYYLHPDARYAVVVSRARSRAKVSVGYSPWMPASGREHDISELCERYGGGGHPVVGAVSLPPGESERAVEIGREMVSALRASPD